MDLETIRDRLATQAYNAPKDFNRDVWLVLKNAKEYFASDEMRKGGHKGMGDLADELMRDFEEDYAATQPKFSEIEGGGKALSVFACDPPLRLPRRRQALARKDLPWKDACRKVLAALGEFVQTERDSAQEDGGAVAAGWGARMPARLPSGAACGGGDGRGRRGAGCGQGRQAAGA